jgi:hypothetical protein
MTLLPAIKAEFLIQLRPHCGMRAYAVAGRVHCCGICGEEVSASDEPWEFFRPDVTPKRGGVIA